MGWPDNTAPPTQTFRFSPIHAYTTFLHIPPLFLLHICISPLQHAVEDHNNIYAGELHLISHRIMRLLCALRNTFLIILRIDEEDIMDIQWLQDTEYEHTTHLCMCWRTGRVSRSLTI
ncbi:hypothetical protein CGRA01v4_07429 [Colletotrichum graminicola]|nr:hypothetical protein CGRA01v4_07429 [Colletotrichum graminicola]